MAFIRTIPEAEATGDVKTLYETSRDAQGRLPNYVTAFSLRPAVWNAAGPLAAAIKANMDLRRYELVTLAAALALECSYCSLAHGQILSDKVLGPQRTETFARDFRESDLTAAEKAMVAFVQKVALRASTVTQDDIDGLRKHGFTDPEIFDITSATTFRCFFSKLFDGIGAQPDHFYADLDPGFRQALTVGRPIEPPPAK